jgi:dolichol kinase
MIEVVSPKGTDNLTVPLLGSIIFILLGGGA